MNKDILRYRNVILAFSFPVFLIMCIIATWDNGIGWYVLPVFLSGCITFNMLIKTVSTPYYYRNIEIMVWTILFINSFVSPLIHFNSELYVSNMIYYPSSWNPYLSLIGFLYLIGNIILMIVLSLKSNIITIKSKWVFKPNAQQIIGFIFFIVLLCQIFVYAKMGGILGYIQKYTDSTSENSLFKGMGIYFLLSELGPFLYIFYFAIKNWGQSVSGKRILIFFITLFLLALFFGGLRGSRSNTLLTMLQGAMTIHLLFYKFKVQHVLYFLLFFFSFMYVGRLYKDQGINIVNYEEAIETRNNIKDRRISNVEELIIGDFSRFGINAYEIYRLQNNTDYKLKYGETYLWGLFTFMPMGSNFVRGFDLSSRTRAATELMYGSGTQYKNSRIFGLLGEWLLNFSILTFFIPYLIAGFVFRKMSELCNGISILDVRILMIPVLMVFIPNLILADFSNIMFFFVKRIFILFIVLCVISKKAI